MAEAKSNAELDLHAMSRDGKYATYRVIPTEPGEGNRVEQILGEPTEAKDSKQSSSTATAATAEPTPKPAAKSVAKSSAKKK